MRSTSCRFRPQTKLGCTTLPLAHGINGHLIQLLHPLTVGLAKRLMKKRFTLCKPLRLQAPAASFRVTAATASVTSKVILSSATTLTGTFTRLN